MADESPEELPVAEFGFPGELRDRLVAAILTGEKTATTGLMVEWELDSESVPGAGDRLLVVDSAEAPVAVIEMEDVRVVRLADVDIAVAHDEGEGFSSGEQWRIAMDETLVVVERFRLINRLDGAGA